MNSKKNSNQKNWDFSYYENKGPNTQLEIDQISSLFQKHIKMKLFL